ncbi:MAG: hypothetical protein V1721_07135 [Pseudomonadota bacterium]
MTLTNKELDESDDLLKNVFNEISGVFKKFGLPHAHTTLETGKSLVIAGEALALTTIARLMLSKEKRARKQLSQP